MGEGADMRFGLIGTGYWARVTHAAGLAAHPDVEFVGVWGRRAEAAQELAAAHSVRAYDTIDDLVADVDAVAFSVPPSVQADAAVRAAEAGRHLLLEKPISLDVDSGRALVQAVQANGVRSVVFFTLRFDADTDAWLRAASAQGGWVTSQLTWFGSIFGEGSPYAQSQWRKDEGALWDVGPHALSLALPLLGPAARVVALRGPGDTVNAVVLHSGGATTALLLSLTAPRAAELNQFTFFGAAGAVTREWSGDVNAAYQRCIQGLLDSSGECDVRFGYEVLAVQSAIARALDAGLAVPVAG
jgi:predicted dehydrogenase